MENSSKKQIEWNFKGLRKNTKKALDFLAGEKWLKRSKWYLAGGTALSLYEGHRVSLDLDFFTTRKDFPPREIINKFIGRKDWKTEIAEPGTIYASVYNTKVSFIAYPFFVPKKEKMPYGNIKVLQLQDIAVMKILAISQRGKKRDFIDLYWYVKNHEPLENILYRLPKQYPTAEHNYHFIFKSMVYFEDAEQDPMPRVLFDTNWEEIKRYFKKEVSRLSKDFYNITG